MSVVLFEVVRSADGGCEGDGGAEPTVGASNSGAESMLVYAAVQNSTVQLSG